MTDVVQSLEIRGVRKFISGKVREVFDLGQTLLVVVTDRISAFDIILPTAIPGKGVVLNQLSQFWFQQTSGIVRNHLITTDDNQIVEAVAASGGEVTPLLSSHLRGRSMLVKKASAFPVECVARGYLSGSLWKEYKTLFAHGGEVCLNGVNLPVGLRESDRLPAPIFTPATKAHSGHDENVSFEMAVSLIGRQNADIARSTTLALYDMAGRLAEERGIIIADTKFEFGLLDDELILIDEALTPDSSRFWDKADYIPGKPQQSFDKQFLRDYLEKLDWDKTDPGPVLPDEIVRKTAAKYRDAFTRITGQALMGLE